MNLTWSMFQRSRPVRVAMRRSSSQRDIVTSPKSPLANISKIDLTTAACSSLTTSAAGEVGVFLMYSYPKMRWPVLLNSPMRSRWSRPRDVFCPLKLGKRAQHGQRQLVLGIVDVVLAADDDLLAVLEEFADDNGLVCHFAGDAVRAEEIDRVEQSKLCVPPHLIEGRSI